ncbi:class I SAM-dependent methyltransferase [Mucilaginibacter litoreus]|uniref:Class I SAM-dependent methyltransferase n=1 Tax=Mucilaginibacter litoreus TaxID=1048221 RepID=A0ABW3APE2_9SPHI
MAANYDNLAFFYDRLSRLVFSNALVNAQVYLLSHIRTGNRILIAGGGTGWILEEISKQHPSGLQITYVEISANMMALSKKRNVGNNQVTFINKPIEKAYPLHDFDVVITPFLFDNFTDKQLPDVFMPIHHALKTGGVWLYTDFQLTGKWWQYLTLKSMLLFFKMLCGVQSWRLPDVGSLFDKQGYHTINQRSFFGDFITSKALVKQ